MIYSWGSGYTYFGTRYLSSLACPQRVGRGVQQEMSTIRRPTSPNIVQHTQVISNIRIRMCVDRGLNYKILLLVYIGLLGVYIYALVMAQGLIY